MGTVDDLIARLDQAEADAADWRRTAELLRDDLEEAELDLLHARGSIKGLREALRLAHIRADEAEMEFRRSERALR